MTTPNEITPIEPVLDTAVALELATKACNPNLQPCATAFFTERGEVAFTGLFDRTLKALEAVKTTRMGISAGSIDLYAAPVAQEPVGWLRNERGLAQGPATLDPLFIIGETPPDGYRATYSPVYAAPVAAQAQPDHFDGVGKLVDPVSGADGVLMTANRAAGFLRRFKHEEKMLGPNEQAAIDFAVSALEAQPQPSGQNKE